MATRLQAPRFVLGDEVTDGTDTGVIVWSYPRKSDGQKFHMVKVLTGGRKGQHIWPNGWSAMLDHDGATPFNASRYRCEQCSRPFLGFDAQCRQCGKRELQEREAYEHAGAGEEPRHGFGRTDWIRRSMRLRGEE